MGQLRVPFNYQCAYTLFSQRKRSAESLNPGGLDEKYIADGVTRFIAVARLISVVIGVLAFRLNASWGERKPT